jgi:enterochelin esterase-like enzyme
VYLPPCYDQQTERSYPVLYLIHGQSYNDDQWERLGADKTADALITTGEVSPFIIVMPRDRYGGQPTEDNFARVIVEELIPYLDHTYRTLPDRAHRAVGGLSRGAGWAVHLAITHWELFSALGAHSPAIFYTDAQKMRLWLDAIPSDMYPRIFIDVGDRDRLEIMDSAVWFEELLNQRNIPHEWYLFSGFHEEAYWHAHIEIYLRWYTKDW